jgi:hypothetical protein
MALFPAQDPLDYVAIDILGPLPRTKKGNQYLLVIADRFSKLVRTVPLSRITAASVAWAFMEQWVYLYGPPRHLLSDNGRQFTSDFFKTCCKAMGVQHIFTSAYHPQANGQVERFNRTILARLRALVGEEQGTWDLYSSAVTYAYNTQVHASTGYSPFDLILSRPPPPSELVFSDAPAPLPTLQHVNDSTCIAEHSSGGSTETRSLRNRLRQRLAIQLPRARLSMDKAGIRYKRNADRRAMAYNPNDLVGKRVALRREIRLNKLEPHGLGLYQVVAADDNTVTVSTIQGPIKISKDRILQSLDDDGPLRPRANVVQPSPRRHSAVRPRLLEPLHDDAHDALPTASLHSAPSMSPRGAPEIYPRSTL